jgi:hypothetical protein
MHSLNYYIKAIEFCESMEATGLASIRMPEWNIFLSDKLAPAEKILAMEAIGVYVRVHKLMHRATLAIKGISLGLLVGIVYSAMA